MSPSEFVFTILQLLETIYRPKENVHAEATKAPARRRRQNREIESFLETSYSKIYYI